MADKHTLNYEVRELKLGASFTDKKASQYHTIKYDFKPASVDVNKMATVDVGTNNQVTVTVPHLDGAGVPQTVFKGSQRPYTKECVLIIDRATGEITLEKLSSNIQVKKTRQENLSKPRPLTPVSTDLLQNTTQRSTSRTRVATNRRGPPAPHNAGVPGVGQPNGAARFNGAGAGGAKAQNMVRSPPRVKTSPPQAAPWSGGGNSTLASLPMIGLDDALGPAPPPAPYQPPSRPERVERAPERVDRAPERIERALDRVDRAPERIERALDRVDRAPERIERALDRVDRAPERIERALDRVDRAPERIERALDRADRAPVDRAPERADRAPERVPERAPERSYVPERQFNSHPPPAAQPPPASQDDSSSSSSSDSGSSSGSDSDSEPDHRLPHAHTNGVVANTSLPSDVLNDDLCLSESGSDSD